MNDADTPAGSPLPVGCNPPLTGGGTNEDLNALFRNLCGIELTDANIPHRLLKLSAYETRPDVIDQATLLLLQVVQQAGRQIPEPYIKWMSDRIVNACNAMRGHGVSAVNSGMGSTWPAISYPLPTVVADYERYHGPAVPPGARVSTAFAPYSAVHDQVVHVVRDHPTAALTRGSSSVPPPVPISVTGFPSQQAEPPFVLREPVVHRLSSNAGEVIMGVVGVVTLIVGLVFIFAIFNFPRPSARSRLPSSSGAGMLNPAIESVGGRPAPAGAVARPNPSAPPARSGRQRELALGHLRTAVGKIKQGFFEAARTEAETAFRVDRTCDESEAVVLVGEYCKRYSQLADEARKALTGNSVVNLGPRMEECPFIEQGDDWITLRVRGENKRFTVQEINSRPGVRFRITSGYLDNAAEPGNDLILGSYQYVHGLDAGGLPRRKDDESAPDRWVKASRSRTATVRDQAQLLLKLPPLGLLE